MLSQYNNWLHDELINGLHINDVQGSHKFKNYLSNIINNPTLNFNGRMQKFTRMKGTYPMRSLGYITSIITVKIDNLSSHYGFIYWRKGTENDIMGGDSWSDLSTEHDIMGGDSWSDLSTENDIMGGGYDLDEQNANNMKQYMSQPLTFDYDRGEYMGGREVWPGFLVDNNSTMNELPKSRVGKKKFTPEYICISPTFDSEDGEFRNRLLLYKKFEDMFNDINLISEMAKIEENILGLIMNNDIDFELRAYTFPIQYSDILNQKIDSMRLLVRSFIVCLLFDGSLNINKIPMQVHTKQVYKDIITILEDHIDYENIDKEKLSPILNILGINTFDISCGQKLIPLTKFASISDTNINYGPWREVYISKLVSDLVVNLIGPMFPLFNSWIYLKKIDKLIFENENIQNLYLRSLKAKITINAIKDIRKDIKSDDMSELDNQLCNSIEYANSFLKMSRNSLCITTEFVGSTIPSWLNILTYKDKINDYESELFNDENNFKKLLFEWTYGVHIVHKKLGIVHSDLHANNITIMKKEKYFSIKRSESVNVKNPVIAYVGNDEDNTYIFPHYGYYGYIIDFSRAIFGPLTSKRINNDFGERFTDNFYRDQVGRVMQVFMRYIPSYTKKHKNTIQARILEDLDTVMRVLSYVDFISLGNNIGYVLDSFKQHSNKELPWLKNPKVVKISQSIITLCNRIGNRARTLFIKYIQKMVKKTSVDIPLAGDILLSEFFEEYKWQNWPEKKLRETNLCNVFNLNNPIEYSSNDYNYFPPWAKYENIEKNIGDASPIDITGRNYSIFIKRSGKEIGSINTKDINKYEMPNLKEYDYEII